MIAKPIPVLEEIQRAVEVIVGTGRGRVVEVRAPNTPEGTWSGYYNKGVLAQDVFDLSSKEDVSNVYWTIQEIDPALLKPGRENNLFAHSGVTTRDVDGKRFIWLPVDCDPFRAPGTSSTDTEKEAALEVAEDIRRFLKELGIESILADSGNGYHVLVPLDILNQNGTNKLVEKVLKALNARFGTPAVGVDTSVFNPSRILKIYGTVARKGEHTDERPWRVSCLVDVPSNLIPLSEEGLRVLLADIMKDLPAETQTEINERKKYVPLAEGVKITPPGRNDACHDYAFCDWTVNGVTPEQLREDVYKFNEEHCDPPLDQDELDRTVIPSVQKFRQRKDEIPLMGGVPAGSTINPPIAAPSASGLITDPEEIRKTLLVPVQKGTILAGFSRSQGPEIRWPGRGKNSK